MKYRLLFIHISYVFADGQNRHPRGSLFLTPQSLDLKAALIEHMKMQG